MITSQVYFIVAQAAIFGEIEYPERLWNSLMSAGGQIVSARKKFEKKFRKIRATHHRIQKILIRRFTPSSDTERL